jgi:hypothetical protein
MNLEIYNRRSKMNKTGNSTLQELDDLIDAREKYMTDKGLELFIYFVPTIGRVEIYAKNKKESVKKLKSLFENNE